MAVDIPFTQYPSYTQQIILDGESFLFQFTWNTRMEAWTVSIFDLDLVEIITGLKLVLNWEHFFQYRHLPLPPGQLLVFDPDPNNKTKIGFEDFKNSRALKLVYIEEDEVLEGAV